MGDAQIGDLVRVELSGRGPATKARVIDRIGDPFAPRSLSMIAIAKHEIPHIFGEDMLADLDERGIIRIGANRAFAHYRW